MITLDEVTIETARAMPNALDLLTPDQVQELTGNSIVTLSRWRQRGYGPKYLKLGRKVWYRRADLDEWLAAQVRCSTAEHKAKAVRE